MNRFYDMYMMCQPWPLMSLQHGSDELTTRGDELAPSHDESRQPAVLSQPQGTGESARGHT